MTAKILVVDDFLASAEMLALVMELKGFEVRQAENGMAALRAVRDFVPDVVLCDINMPIMPGHELCRIMKADPRFEKTLFVAQTAVGSAEGRQASAAAGFDHHLVKPLDIGIVNDLIVQHLALVGAA